MITVMDREPAQVGDTKSRHDPNQLSVRLTGTKPLLMSNGRMADPSNEHAMKYALHSMAKPNTRTKKVKESPELLDAWFEKERKLVFFGSLYYGGGLGFHVPADNLLFMAREAFFGYNTTTRGGDRFQSILSIDREAVALNYSGPRTPEERWESGEDVGYRCGLVPNRALGGAKVRVLQAMFEDWSLDVTYKWTQDALVEGLLGRGKNFTREFFLERLMAQGRTFGLGAYRKSANWGCFTVDVIA